MFSEIFWFIWFIACNTPSLMIIWIALSMVEKDSFTRNIRRKRDSWFICSFSFKPLVSTSSGWRISDKIRPGWRWKQRASGDQMVVWTNKRITSLIRQPIITFWQRTNRNQNRSTCLTIFFALPGPFLACFSHCCLFAHLGRRKRMHHGIKLSF